MIENLIQILKNDNISIANKDIDNFNQNSNPKDAIYPLSVFIFENPKINHNNRLKAHLELIKISKLKRSDFSIAHNLNLSSRVYSVLGYNDEAIKNDLEALKYCGLSAAPPNSPILNYFTPDYVTLRASGDGSFRCFADLILKANNIIPTY